MPTDKKAAKAQAALDVANRKVERLNDRLVALDAERAQVDAELTAAQKWQLYAEANPDLPGVVDHDTVFTTIPPDLP